ncbi:hypothetical protein GBA65_11770 [Rubrobacter marinus]|uniref:ABM domain-containing protein n=1 Tax=Rubrobacter marinus TaxID=2653852 RepID=A0A6G8PY74_9ACTN|nr:hypothetical protein [Rubrobacter marinus]QIN79087.1 hypothetical protein GBA65_11770 [Rubrobacter marinus]
MERHVPSTRGVGLEVYEAFGRLAPQRAEYASLPIRDGFDWEGCAAGLDAVDLYLVVFRSVRRAAADDRLLKEYDDRAYDEALASGGVLRYFRGRVNERRECLSFCLWESRRHAVTAAGKPAHGEAARISEEMYESYDLERYLVRKPRRDAGLGIEQVP